METLTWQFLTGACDRPDGSDVWGGLDVHTGQALVFFCQADPRSADGNLAQQMERQNRRIGREVEKVIRADC